MTMLEDKALDRLMGDLFENPHPEVPHLKMLSRHLRSLVAFGAHYFREDADFLTYLSPLQDFWTLAVNNAQAVAQHVQATEDADRGTMRPMSEDESIDDRRTKAQQEILDSALEDPFAPDSMAYGAIAVRKLREQNDALPELREAPDSGGRDPAVDRAIELLTRTS